MVARLCALLSPKLESPPSALVVAWLPRLTDSMICAWCTAARSCQSVMVIEVPKAPPTIRMKLDKPEAEAICAGGMPPSVMLLKGIKKNATATPCTMVGTMMVKKSACVLKCARISSTSANITKANVASMRGSVFCTFLPTMGESKMANKPTGASSMPAWVEV